MVICFIWLLVSTLFSCSHPLLSCLSFFAPCYLWLCGSWPLICWLWFLPCPIKILFSLHCASGSLLHLHSPLPHVTSPVLILHSPGKMPLTLSAVQEWLNKMNMTTVAKFPDTSVCGGSWCLDTSLSPFLVKFTQILESILLDKPLKAVVLSVGCASFSSTLFPSTQLSGNMLGYSTLWTANFFGN